jgi:hypothetical protein
VHWTEKVDDLNSNLNAMIGELEELPELLGNEAC